MVFRVNLSNGRREPVSTLWHGLDVAGGSRAFTERFANDGDSEREIGLFDKSVRPELLHQELLLDQLPAVAHEDQQHREGFRRQRNQQPVSLQAALFRLEPEVAEQVVMLSLAFSSACESVLQSQREF